MAAQNAATPQAGDDTVRGGSSDDRAEEREVFGDSGNNNDIDARDGEQDLICVASGSGSVDSDRQDRFIFNESC